MKLKNYASSSPLNNIFSDIEKTLVSHGAKQITRDYNDAGTIVAIAFLINTSKGEVRVRLPARTERVKRLFDQQGIGSGSDYLTEDEARNLIAIEVRYVSKNMANNHIRRVKQAVSRGNLLIAKGEVNVFHIVVAFSDKDTLFSAGWNYLRVIEPGIAITSGYISADGEFLELAD